MKYKLKKKKHHKKEVWGDKKWLNDYYKWEKKVGKNPFL